VLLFTELTSAPNDESIDIKYWQKYVKRCRQYPFRYCIWKVSL